MMKMAFPNAKNPQDAMLQAQQMMQSMMGGGARGGPAKGKFPANGGGQLNPKDMQGQMKAAMEMLQQMQKKK